MLQAESAGSSRSMQICEWQERDEGVGEIKMKAHCATSREEGSSNGGEEEGSQGAQPLQQVNHR